MRLRVAIALAAQVVCVTPGYSEPAGSIPADELSRQSAIYNSRGDAVPQGYTVDRSLLSYAFSLPPGFTRSLASLGPADRWLDIGAGEGRAILDYRASRYEAMFPQRSSAGKAKAVAMSIEDRRTSQWHNTAAALPPQEIQYLVGRRLREYSADELGRFDLITDVLGGFSYTRFMSVYLQNTLNLLEVDGTFYTLLQDVRAEHGRNKPFYPDATFLTEIRNADGAEQKICSWLKSITCVEVSCDYKADRHPPIERYTVRKVCNDVQVPGLVPVHFEAGTPPERRFRPGNPASALAEATRRRDTPTPARPEGVRR